MTVPHIVVAAAVVERDDRFFVTRRHAGVHLEGYWEFPGGKCEPAESLEECLVREIREELAVGVAVRREILASTHRYPDRVVELRFFACEMVGEPRAVLGQEMKWVAREDLATLKLPPADDELVKQLSAGPREPPTGGGSRRR